jgi:hypothetical protein
MQLQSNIRNFNIFTAKAADQVAFWMDASVSRSSLNEEDNG